MNTNMINQKLKVSLSLALLLATVPGVALAKDCSEGKNYKRGEKIERLTERLNLSEQQATEVKSIFETAFKDKSCKELDSKKESRACWKEKMEKTNSEISKLLDKEQQLEFAKLQEERKAKWAEKRAKREESTVE